MHVGDVEANVASDTPRRLAMASSWFRADFEDTLAFPGVRQCARQKMRKQILQTGSGLRRRLTLHSCGPQCSVPRFETRT